MKNNLCCIRSPSIKDQLQSTSSLTNKLAIYKLVYAPSTSSLWSLSMLITIVHAHARIFSKKSYLTSISSSYHMQIADTRGLQLY